MMYALKGNGVANKAGCEEFVLQSRAKCDKGGSKSETMGTSFMDGHLSECTHMILIFFAGFTA